MKLRVLGCSGGIGGRALRTTSFLVDHDILVDAGTGVADLSIDELAAVEHVFITHSHLDHIAALPLMIDAVAERRSKPLLVYALAEVIELLQAHIFNWSIWPDFSQIPSPEMPVMRFRPIQINRAIVLNGRRFTALPVDHTVPAVAYWLDSGSSSLVFSGDTGPCDKFWSAVNEIPDLRYLLIECAFSDGEEALAFKSKHLTPRKLVDGLSKLRHRCEILITHLKPGQYEITLEQLSKRKDTFSFGLLENNRIFDF